MTLRASACLLSLALGLAAVSAASPARAQATYEVVLTAAGPSKIAAIKVVRELTGLGLKESKDLVEAAPRVVRTGLSRSDAQAARDRLVKAGASAMVRPASAAEALPEALPTAPPPTVDAARFDVVLTAAGSRKIAVIKAVRALTGLGLRQAKALVEGAPRGVKSGLDRAEAERARQQLTEAGASVELRASAR